MNNPEFRQTLHNISHNLESANQAAQENIYTFTQQYIDPCLEGIKSCLYDCTEPCFPNREDNFRRKRGRSRGRAEYNFDFYDAWDDDEAHGDTSMSWGNDELDSLLAGHGPRTSQPRKQRAMSYGSKGRRTPSALPQDPEQDPTILPSSSYLGFLERLPWKIGARKLRYKPSAADLQENPGGARVRDAETEPLIEEQEEESGTWRKSHGRQRSDTTGSRSTTNSLSSRGDLIMSDEDEDAVPLDDEFAVMLSRRMTNQGLAEDQSSSKSKTPNSKRPGASRRSTRTFSSKSLASPSRKSQRSSSQRSLSVLSPNAVLEQPEQQTLQDLKWQEEQAEQEEELEIQQKREAAQRLAIRRGLSSGNIQTLAHAEVKPDDQDDHPGAMTPITDEFDADLESPAEPISMSSLALEQSGPESPGQSKTNDTIDPT